MWIARNKDKSLSLFKEKPVRSNDLGWWWYDENVMKVDSSLYPNLMWEDEPIEVEFWSNSYWKRTIEDIAQKVVAKQVSGEYRCLNDIVESITKEMCDFEHNETETQYVDDNKNLLISCPICGTHFNPNILKFSHQANANLYYYYVECPKCKWWVKEDEINNYLCK